MGPWGEFVLFVTISTSSAERSFVTTAHPSGDERFAVVDKQLKRGKYSQDLLIEALHTAQDVFGYLTDDILMYVARALALPPSMVLGVATFYHLFEFEAPGEHSCSICTGTACYVKGADDIVAAISERYGVAAGSTSEDGRLTLRTARCLGSCSLAPMIVYDGEVSSHQSPASTIELIEASLARTREEVG